MMKQVYAKSVLLMTSAMWMLPGVLYAQTTLQNPLEFRTITEFIQGAFSAVVMIALPLVTLALVYSGFLFIKAQGNQEALTKAKQNFLYVVIGSILVLGMWAIATLIGGTIDQLR